jgi:hypothetical protein
MTPPAKDGQADFCDIKMCLKTLQITFRDPESLREADHMTVSQKDFYKVNFDSAISLQPFTPLQCDIYQKCHGPRLMVANRVFIQQN